MCLPFLCLGDSGAGPGAFIAGNGGDVIGVGAGACFVGAGAGVGVAFTGAGAGVV